MGKFTRVKDFTSTTVVTAAVKVKDFVIGLYNHLESVAVLSLASMGLSTLLSEIPFLVALPAFVEGPMVIPVLAVMAILALMKLAEYRNVRRNDELAVA